MNKVDDEAPAPTPISAEDKAFLDAIIAEPDSDERRLEYAAYLRQKGDLRGELIEVQCALARRPRRSERIALKKQEAALFRQGRRAWEAKLQKTRLHAQFRRGFMEELRGYNFKFSGKFLPAIFATEPIQKLQISVDTEGDVKKLVGMGFVGRIRSLYLYGIESDKLVKVLSKSLKEPSLRSLSFGYRGLDPKAAELLGSSPVFAGIERLNLTGSRLTDETLAVILDAKPSFRLKAIYLSRCSITSKGLKALLGSPVSERLSILCVNHNEDIKDDAFIALARAKAAEHLTFVEAKGTGLGERGAKALAASPHLAHLISLRIAGTPAARKKDSEGVSLLKARWGSKVLVGAKSSEDDD